jgi:hypothetical protein
MRLYAIDHLRITARHLKRVEYSDCHGESLPDRAGKCPEFRAVRESPTRQAGDFARAKALPGATFLIALAGLTRSGAMASALIGLAPGIRRPHVGLLDGRLG